jgi:hypothetical protein
MIIMINAIDAKQVWTQYNSSIAVRGLDSKDFSMNLSLRRFDLTGQQYVHFANRQAGRIDGNTIRKQILHC